MSTVRTTEPLPENPKDTAPETQRMPPEQRKLVTQTVEQTKQQEGSILQQLQDNLGITELQPRPAEGFMTMTQNMVNQDKTLEEIARETIQHSIV